MVAMVQINVENFWVLKEERFLLVTQQYEKAKRIQEEKNCEMQFFSERCDLQEYLRSHLTTIQKFRLGLDCNPIMFEQEYYF